MEKIQEIEIKVGRKKYIVAECPSYPGFFTTKDGKFVFRKKYGKYIAREILFRNPGAALHGVCRQTPYKVVWHTGKGAYPSVHCLVADAWIGPRPIVKGEKIVVSHEDGNFLNNRAENLAYVLAEKNKSGEITRRYGKNVAKWVRVQKKYIHLLRGNKKEQMIVADGLDMVLSVLKILFRNGDVQQ